MHTLRNTFITGVENDQIQPYKVIRMVCSFRSKFFQLAFIVTKQFNVLKCCNTLIYNAKAHLL